MRPLLIIAIAMLIPALCNAQFQSKIYDLKTERVKGDKKGGRLEELKTNVENEQVKLVLDSVVTDVFGNQIATVHHFDSVIVTDNAEHAGTTARADSIANINQIIDSVSDAVVEKLAVSKSRKDSLALIFRRLANPNLTLDDPISPLVALGYRNIIDQKIKSNYSFNSGVYSVLAKGTALNEDTIGKLNEITANTPQLRLARNYFDYLYRSEDNPVDRTWFFPLKSISHAEYFYFGENGEQIKLLSEFGLQTNFANNVTAQSEILSGILPFEVFGKSNPKRRISFPIKFDLGTTISKDDADSTETGKEKSISDLLYGGLTHGRFSYPLFYSNWKYPNGKGMRLYAPITTTFNWTSNLNESNFLKDMYYFGEIASNLFYEVDIIQNEGATSDAKLFLNGKLAFIDGGSKFYDQNTLDRYGIWLLQLNGGIRIKDQFTIAVNVPVWSSQKVLSERQFASLALIFSPGGAK